MRRKALSIIVILCMWMSLCSRQEIFVAANTNLTSEQIADYFNSKVGNSVPEASCLAFIANGFQNLGATWSSACCAYKYGSAHIVSTSKENIPIGADVFFTWKSSYGGTWFKCKCGNYGHHIGVYVGDGYVVHTSSGKVVKTSLDKLLTTYKLDFRGWGYHGNVNIVNTSMSLNKTSISLEFGEVNYLEVTSGISTGETVTWKTSNKNIVSVASNGTMAYLTGAGSGTATVTATCGSKVATCKVTVNGGDDEPILTITNDGATKITETSARINASISPGMIIEEAGFYYGTSKTSLTQKKETVNSYTTTIWYDLGTGKWTSALKPNTTYYYQLYVKVNGETYKTAISSFKTAQGETYTLTNSAVSNLTTTSARIKATLSPGATIEKAEFYYGTSSSSLTKKTETVGSYTTTVYYDLGTGKWCSALKTGTTYYYQLYVVINGTEYKSALAKFTTAKNTLKTNSDLYTSLSVSDITETSAKIRADYPKNTYDDAGFYFGTTADLASMTKTSEYAYGGTPSVSYTNSYKLGVKYDGYGYKWSNPLSAGTKYYYAFYLVLDGTEYVSTIKNFTTSGTASITNVAIASYPSKKDYVVGESIDTTGVKLTVTYSNGKTATVTSGITVSGNASAVGTRQITLKYQGYTFKYNINVTQPLTGISLSQTSATMDVYDVLTLNVTYNPTNTTDSKDVTWKSSNTSVVTVENGMLVAVGGGSATITATCGSKSATCKVTVRIPVTAVTLNKTSAILTTKGEKVSLQATITPSNAANKNVTWLSSDTSVATVNANGVVTAVGEGITTISVTTASGNLTAVCVITVDYPENDVENSEEESTYPSDIPVNSENNTQNSESESEVKKTQNSETETGTKTPQNSESENDVNEPQDSETEYNVDEPQSSEIESDVDESQIVEITNESGVVFTFMLEEVESVEGVEMYDFSTDIVTDFTEEEELPFEVNECVVKIKYAHSGDLPGNAIISIPVGTEWAGKTLYYYQVFENGEYKYTGESAVVDANGNFIIRQSHCSDYIVSTKNPLDGNVGQNGNGNLLYFAIGIGVVLIIGGTVVFVKKRTK